VAGGYPVPADSGPPRCLDRLAVHSKEVRRRHHSQVGIPRDPERPLARPFGEISFGQCLQTPGDAPEQMFPVPDPRFFLKHLPILHAQSRQRRPAQALDFYQYGIVHFVLVSSP
jgi:hypothetical protein